VTDRLWGLPFLLVGLYFVLMPRERFKREAKSDARQSQQMFPWMSERMVQAQVRTQLILRWIVPPVVIVFGVLTLLGVLDVGGGGPQASGRVDTEVGGRRRR
jgi:cytochrome c-type biogenesis protein CcmH/NrfF